MTGACSCAEREPSEPLEAAASEIGAQASGYLATEPVEVISEEKASELHLKTARAATVTGRVLDESESPVPGALVEINRSHAVTDEAGAFVIDGLPWGEEVFAQADGGDVGSGRIGPISPPADDLVIRVRKHGRLSGRVLDSDTGQAIDAFCVDSGYESPVPGGRNFQNGDGAFHWDGLEEGTYSVSVMAEGYEPYVVRNVRIAPGKATEEVVFPLQRGRVVQGQVIDATTGKGIGGTRIRHRSGTPGTCQDELFTTVSDDSGYFSLNGLPRRPTTIEVTALRYPTKHVAADGNLDEYLKIGLAQGASLYGRVFGPDGELMYSASIRLTEIRAHTEPRTTFTDPRGRFEFHGLRAGEYRVGAKPVLSIATVERDLSVVPGKEIRDFEIHFDSSAGTGNIGGIVSGLIEGERASVSIREGTERAAVDEDGFYGIVGVPAGEGIHVSVGTDRGRVLRKTLNLGEGEDARLDFAFSGTARLFGRITRDGKGTPAFLQVWPMGGLAAEGINVGARTSSNGYYEIAGLSPGEHLLYISEYTNLHVQVDDETRLDVDICRDPPPGTSVPGAGPPVCRSLAYSGKVIAAGDGSGLRGVSVMLTGQPDGGGSTSTDDQGRFEIQALGAGDYLLSAYRQGYEVFTQRISLRESMKDATVELASASGQTLRLSEANTGRPLTSVRVGVAKESRLIARFQIFLGKDGVGVLSRSLTGYDLTLEAISYRPHGVPSWAGEPLSAGLSACRMYTKGCFPGPLRVP